MKFTALSFALLSTSSLVAATFVDNVPPPTKANLARRFTPSSQVTCFMTCPALTVGAVDGPVTVQPETLEGTPPNSDADTLCTYDGPDNTVFTCSYTSNGVLSITVATNYANCPSNAIYGNMSQCSGRRKRNLSPLQKALKKRQFKHVRKQE